MEYLHRDSTFFEGTPFKTAMYLTEDELRFVDTLYIKYEDLKDNFDIFTYLTNYLLDKHVNKINVDSFMCAKYINDHLKDRSDLCVYVLDDYNNIMRNVNLDEFDKIKVYVPISYLPWNLEFKDKCLTYSSAYKNNGLICNGNEEVSIDTLKRLRDIVLSINKNKYTDLEKVILVANYLEKNTEYLADNLGEEYISIDGIDFSKIEDAGFIETILNKKYGLCTGIANITTLMLNNPDMNVYTRSICGCNHFWNIVRINKEYYMADITWCITRSDTPSAYAIKTTDFSSKYLLLGSHSTNNLDNHFGLTDFDKEISYVDYKRKYIDKCVKRLKKDTSFTYSDTYHYGLIKKY